VADLTESDQRTIEKAREIGQLRAKDIPAYTGDEDAGMAYAVAFGRAQWELNGLLAIIDRLTAKSDAPFIDTA